MSVYHPIYLVSYNAWIVSLLSRADLWYRWLSCGWVGRPECSPCQSCCTPFLPFLKTHVTGAPPFAPNASLPVSSSMTSVQLSLNWLHELNLTLQLWPNISLKFSVSFPLIPGTEATGQSVWNSTPKFRADWGSHLWPSIKAYRKWIELAWAKTQNWNHHAGTSGGWT